MVLGAIIGGALGIGSSLFGASQQRSAAAEANAMARKQAEAQYARAKKEWEIDFWQQQTNYLWDMARHEALKFSEKQKKADYKWRNKRLIESAMENLAVNRDALADKFLTEEGLRAKQEKIGYAYNMDRLRDEATEQVRQYMTAINDNALQSSKAVSQTERQSRDLVASLSFDMQKDNMQWQLSEVAALLDSRRVEAVASTRMGGSESGQRLAMNKAQELGRTWGQVEMQSRARRAQLASFNEQTQGETATELSRIALATQDQAERIKYTNNRFSKDWRLEQAKMKELTLPGFDLAQRQYTRELKSLQIQTQGIVNEASMPYRKPIYFKPQAPIKGLKPQYWAPSKVYSPSTGAMIGGALLGGMQGAINLGTYTKTDGTLGWR